MHPVLFSIPTPWGAIPIYSYGVMLGSSLLFAWYFIMYMGKKIEGYNRELRSSAPACSTSSPTSTHTIASVRGSTSAPGAWWRTADSSADS
jgi:hypothetical protein